MYLRIKDNNFGFAVEGIHDILSTDIIITNAEYDKFFQLQSEGKQFRLKKVPTGVGLFDYVEEYVHEIDNTPKPPSIEERMSAMEMALMEVL
ncbi:hypothetical protein [Clostridium sp.]|uniref:hypothetical protein n=1 Tax=Clostridium sp. TaxID=1506 RepID=UPI003216FAC6